MSFSTEPNLKRSFYEKRLFVCTRPVLSISSTSLKSSLAQDPLLVGLARNYGLICASRQGSSILLIFANQNAQKAAAERCKSKGVESQAADAPSRWKPPHSIESTCSSDDRHFYVACLDLTTDTKTFESDQFVHEDWDHNYRWYVITEQLRHPAGGFFVSQDVLAGIRSIETKLETGTTDESIVEAVEDSSQDQTVVDINAEDLRGAMKEGSLPQSRASPSKRHAPSPPSDPHPSLHTASPKRSRSTSPAILAPSPVASSHIATLEAVASTPPSITPELPGSSASVESPTPLSSLLPIQSGSPSSTASHLTPPPPAFISALSTRSASAPVRGVPIQVPKNPPLPTLPPVPPDKPKQQSRSASVHVHLAQSGLVSSLRSDKLEGLLKTWGPLTSILRIPREYASRVVGQQGQTVRLIVEKSQVGIQIEQSLQKEWSLVYFAGSKRGDTGKAIELIEKRVREVAGKNWSRNGNLVALS